MDTSARRIWHLHQRAGKSDFDIQGRKYFLQSWKANRFFAFFEIINNGLSDARQVRKLISRQTTLFEMKYDDLMKFVAQK